jgi:glycosyltransferase involved in cell wall biosynthesis
VVPASWKINMARMDEIWAPSRANIEWYRENGIEKPMRVLPHGVNTDHWPPRRRRVGKRFVFLHMGEPTPRKGGRMAYDAFKTLFGDDERYLLILKGKPRFNIDISNVQVVPEYLQWYELRDLYHKANVMLYPGNGEGFGLIPFQAAASGMPTIVTEWGGHLDYIDYCIPIAVDGLCEVYEPHLGLWANPSFDDFLQKISMVVEDYDSYAEWAYERSFAIHQKWSWDRIAATSIGWFESLLSEYQRR